MKNEINEVPISLPDGTKVKVGIKVYTLDKLSVYSKWDHQKYPKSSILKWSGNISSRVIENTVIHVNQSAASRSFTIRSDRGCEHTYSVKNTCLPDIFGSKAAVVSKQKKITREEIKEIDKRYKIAQEELRKEIARVGQALLKYTKTVKALKQAKY